MYSNVCTLIYVLEHVLKSRRSKRTVTSHLNSGTELENSLCNDFHGKRDKL